VNTSQHAPHRHTPRRHAGTWAVALACVLALAGCAGGPTGSPAASSTSSVLTPVPGEATPGIGSASPAESSSPDASAPPPSPAPSEDQVPDTPATVACNGTDVAFAASVLNSPVRVRPDTPIGAGLRRIIEAGLDELQFPPDGWRLASLKPGRATLVAPSGTSWVFATMAQQADGSWEYDEGGHCELAAKTPAGLGFASWELDPAAPPAADSTRLSIAGREVACANGKGPGERALPAIVDESAASVTITLLVRKLGSADCPSNPTYPVEVSLSQPLGTRALLDGSVYPPARRN
jgi:hypothetical protein